MKPRLSVLRTQSPVIRIDDRGKLMQADEIAAEIFNAKVSKKWVFANVPSVYRHKVGRLVLYYEGEVRAWVESLREAA